MQAKASSNCTGQLWSFRASRNVQKGKEAVIAGFGDFCISRYLQVLSLRDFESMSC
jgi:hypothetical protein